MMVQEKKILIKVSDADYMRQNGFRYVLSRSGNNTYICGNCNENHKTGLYLYTKNGIPKCKCFHCGIQGDVFEYVGEVYGYSNFYDKQIKTAELMNLKLGDDTDNKQVKQVKKVKPKLERKSTPNQDTDISRDKDINTKMQENKSFFERAHRRLLSTQGVHGRDYLYRRRISDETINKYNIGFSKEDNIIFPITYDFYIERDIKKKRYLNRCLNGIKLFKNFKYSDLQEFAIVLVCEGLIDTLTALQTKTFGKAISLNGISNADKFIETAAALKDKNIIYVVQLDLDEVGKSTQEYIVKELNKQGIFAHSSLILEKAAARHKNIKDINELYCIDELPLLRNFKSFHEKMQQYQQVLKKESK